MSSSDVTARLPRAYWRLWTASTISNLGDGVFIVALPLLATRLTRSELAISFIGVAAALPWLLLSLPIGAVVDRIDHRLLMVRADVIRAVIIGALTVAVATDSAQMWMVWVAAGCLGIAEVFFDNASQAILPSIVPIGLIERANGRRFAAEVAANSFVGTLLGSLLFVAAVWLPFGVDAASFAIAAFLVFTLHTATRPRPAAAPTPTRLRGEIAEGLRWLMRHRLLRGLALAASLSLLGMQMTAAIFVLFAQDLLHLSDKWYGALIAIGAVGRRGGRARRRTIDQTARHVGDHLRHRRRVDVVHVRRGVLAATVGQRGGDDCDGVRHDCVEHRDRFTATAHRAAATCSAGSTACTAGWCGARSRSGPPSVGVVAHVFGLRAPFFFGAAMGGIALITLVVSITRASHRRGRPDRRPGEPRGRAGGARESNPGDRSP